MNTLQKSIREILNNSSERSKKRSKDIANLLLKTKMDIGDSLSIVKKELEKHTPHSKEKVDMLIDQIQEELSLIIASQIIQKINP